MQLIFKEINLDEINLIKPLWEKLNELHYQDSIFFKEHYKNNTFEKRCEKFYILDPEDIKILIVSYEQSALGYCVSTINRENSIGEIESIYINKEVRENGVGTKLINDSIQWFKHHACKKIVVSVADGHESVVEFYKKIGFYPRLTYLEFK